MRLGVGSSREAAFQYVKQALHVDPSRIGITRNCYSHWPREEQIERV
jgi:hypothetical protein